MLHPNQEGVSKTGCNSSYCLEVLLPLSTNVARGVIARGVVGVVGDLADKLSVYLGASAAGAVPGLSMGSVVGALMKDVCAVLSVSFASATFAAAGDTGAVAARDVWI